MSSFWSRFAVLYTCFHLAVLQLECSDSQACLGDVIRCQCQNDQRTILSWRVFGADMTTILFNQVYIANSQVGSPTTMGAYSAILNSTDPFSSQLTILIEEPELTVDCDTGTLVSTTLQSIEAPPGRPASLNVIVSPTPAIVSNATVTLWWASPTEDTLATVTEYLISITELVTGLSQQLSSSNMSVTTQLNTAGEYLVQVVAVNCAGTSQGSAAILFNITEQCLLLGDCSQQQSTTTDSTPFVTTRQTGNINMSSTSTPPTATAVDLGCVESWHIGIAVACIVIIQIISTTICVTTAVVLKNKRAKDVSPVVMEMSPGHTEQVQNEEHGQGDPMYDDILPHAKDEGTVIELEGNVAYSIANKQEHHH